MNRQREGNEQSREKGMNRQREGNEQTEQREGNEQTEHREGNEQSREKGMNRQREGNEQSREKGMNRRNDHQPRYAAWQGRVSSVTVCARTPRPSQPPKSTEGKRSKERQRQTFPPAGSRMIRVQPGPNRLCFGGQLWGDTVGLFVGWLLNVPATC